MAQRATSLGPKPSLFFCFCFFLFFVFFFAFLYLFFQLTKKPVFPLKKDHFLFIFSVSLCFSLAFFGPPPFLPFLFLCLSRLFLSSFLPVFHFLFSGSCFFFLLCLLFLFQDVLLFLFFCLLSSIITFNFFLLCLFSGCCFFCSSCFAILLFFDFRKPVKKKALKKMEIRKTAKMKNAEKTDILTKAVSTVVFTNSVFVSFLCFFQFCMFC